MATFLDGCGARHFESIQTLDQKERGKIPDQLVIQLFDVTNKWLAARVQKIEYPEFHRSVEDILCGKVQFIRNYKIADGSWLFDIKLSTRTDFRWQQLEHMPEGLDALSWDREAKLRFDTEAEPYPRETIERTRIQAGRMEVLVKFVKCSHRMWLNVNLITGSLSGASPQILAEITQWRNCSGETRF